MYRIRSEGRNTSMYALAKTSLFSTALKDNHNITVSHELIENLRVSEYR